MGCLVHSFRGNEAGLGLQGCVLFDLPYILPCTIKYFSPLKSQVCPMLCLIAQLVHFYRLIFIHLWRQITLFTYIEHGDEIGSTYNIVGMRVQFYLYM